MKRTKWAPVPFRCSASIIAPLVLIAGTAAHAQDATGFGSAEDRGFGTELVPDRASREANGALGHAGSVSFDPDEAFAEGRHHFSILWENDGSWAKRIDSSDRFYTNGIQATLSFAQPTPGPLTGWLADALGYDRPRTAVGVAVTHRMYTPEDITIAAARPDDHPWAGHVGFSGYAQVAQDGIDGRPDQMDHLEVRLGWVGERAGAAGLQVFVHAAVPDQVRPEGWSNQLSNELTFLAKWQRRWRVWDGAFGEPDDQRVGDLGAGLGRGASSGSERLAGGWDLIAHLGGAAGNETVFAETGLQFRAGLNLPRDFGPARIADFRDATADRLDRDPLSVYAFVRGNVKLVAWDLFVDGNAFASGPGGVDSREVVADLHFGFAFRYKCFELGYALTYLTDEFYGQSGDGHSYGTVRLGASFQF